MKRVFFSPRDRHHLHKTLHNLRVTLLCSLLTFIVLRSSIGAGKFGTPVQDYDEIRHHLHNFRLRHQENLLIRRELANNARLRKDASRSTLSLPTLPSDQELDSDGDGSGGGVDRTVGARPHTASSTPPRTMLVTSSSLLAKCDSTIEAQFLLKLLKNKMDYCRLHGIEVLFDPENNVEGEVAMLHLFRKLWVLHPEVDWIWWMDITAMVTNMSYQLPYNRYTGHNVVTHSLDGASHGVGQSILVRNSEWTQEYLANAERQAARLSAEASVDMETKMEVYGPNLGVGNTWPFITDFRSCNVCNKDIDLSCLSHIERAFTFADGQHIGM